MEIPVAADAKNSVCGGLVYDETAELLWFVSDSKHLWLLPLSTGVAVDLGEATISKLLPELVIYEDHEQRLFAYSLAERRSIPLGVTLSAEFQMKVYADSQWLLTCGENGLYSVALTELRTRVVSHLLDARACEDFFNITDGQLTYESSVVFTYFNDESALRAQRVKFRVPLDGSAAPQLVESLERLGMPPFGLARCKNGLRAYALNQGETNYAEWSDAWINGWRFSTAASEVAFSEDCRRVRWKERSSKDGIGELYSALIGSDKRLRLGRNAGRYFELPDGRVLAQINIVGTPPNTDLVLIDEEARLAHWLLDNTWKVYAAQPLPQLGSLFVALINDGAVSGNRYLLLPLPRRAPAL